MVAAPTISVGPDALVEFALGLAHASSAADEVHVRETRIALTQWIRATLASEQSLLARAEHVAQEVEQILETGKAEASDAQRMRQFALATRAALAQYAADREIDRELAELVRWSQQAKVADVDLVSAQTERADHHVRAATRWTALAELLDDVSDVLAVVDARAEQGTTAPAPWTDVKRDLGLAE